MNMRIQNLIANGQSLHILKWDDEIVDAIWTDMSRSDYFHNTFTRFFLAYLGDWLAIQDMDKEYINLVKEQALRQILVCRFLQIASNELLIPISENRVLNSQMNENDLLALLQNSFIHAIASCYASQIQRGININIARSPVSLGEIMFSNSSETPLFKKPTKDKIIYIDYLLREHLLLATYIQSKHRFRNKKIMSVAGYLLYPDQSKGNEYD